MKKQTEKLKVYNIERLNNSIYGNPRYLLILEDSDGERIEAKTASNAACAYSIGYSSIDKEYLFTYHETKNGNIIIDYIKEV